MKKIVFPFMVVSLLLTVVTALKLTLNQDLSDLPRELSPEEIGQFLHSIKDLPKLAEYLDPSRPKVNFDLFYFYNNYGCAENRIFNWDRISMILSYGGLSREDRSLLLNGKCLMKWPGLSTIDHHQLKFLFSLLPESNLLLQINESSDIDFWRDMLILYRTGIWPVLLDNAQNSSHHLNFIPQIGLLFRENLIHFADLKTSRGYRISLIGPELVDECFLRSRKRSYRMECNSMVFERDKNYRNFSTRDLFFWALNIATATKYDLQSRNVLKLQGHFDKMIEACPWYEDHVVYFISNFSLIICDYISKDFIDSKKIYELIESLCTWNEGNGTNYLTLDPLFLAVEFYKWTASNSDYYVIDVEIVKKSLKLIHKKVSGTRINVDNNLNNNDYYLNFLISTSVRGKLFKTFLRNNYNAELPSEKLVETLKRISLKSVELTHEIKSFLDVRIRLRLLRQKSFDHPNHFVSDVSIKFHVSDETPISKTIFEGVYESLLENSILVFPLNVNVSESYFMKEFLNDSKISDITLILKRFWSYLGQYVNGFFEIRTHIESRQDYSPEFLPNPWTHPNVLLAAGRTMTLAILHGVKLEGWSIKRSLFKTLFKITPKFVESNEDNFINFSSTNDYVKELEDYEVSFDSIKELISVPIESSVKPFLTRFLNNLLKVDSEECYTFSNEANMTLSSKIFTVLETFDVPDDSKYDSDFIFDSIKSRLLSDLTEEQLIYHWSTMIESEVSNQEEEFLRIEMAKVQIYSLFVGLEPVTRFLKSDEVYDLLFKYEQ